jgi:hypothetical protein
VTGRVKAAIEAFLFRPASAVSLALFRIVTGVAVIGSVALHQPVAFSRLPRTLRVMPRGAQLLYGVVDPRTPVVVFATTALVIAAIMMTIGLWTRWSVIATGVLGVYVLGVPQIYGKVSHYHHVVWFCFALALAPAGAAWSVDAWRRRDDPLPKRSAQYGFSLAIAGLTIGLIYLYPGLAKLRTAGLHWAFSDNLRNIVYMKATLGRNWHPILDITAHPLVYQLGALAVMALEVTFVVLLLTRRLAPVAVIGGLAFHAMTYLTLRISFWSLILGYVVFVDWVLPQRSQPVARTGTARPPRAALYCGVAFLALLSAVDLAVFTPRIGTVESGWPIAAYPSFSGIVGPSITTVQVDAVIGGRVVHNLGRRSAFGDWMNTDRYSGLLNSLDREPAQTQRRLVAFADASRRLGHLPTGTTQLRFYRRTIATTPTHRGRVVKETELGHAVAVHLPADNNS